MRGVAVLVDHVSAVTSEIDENWSKTVWVINKTMQ